VLFPRRMFNGYDEVIDMFSRESSGFPEVVN